MCEACRYSILEKFSKNLMKKNKGPILKVSVPKSVQTKILQTYSKSKGEYSSSMQDALADFVSGKISKATYLSRQKAAIKKAYSEAFTLGKQFNLGAGATLTSDERKTIAFLASEEMKFMSNFANDIGNSAGRMPYGRRLQMYIDGLDGVFGFGRIAFLPDEIKIIWKLGVTDKHCLDCLSYVANNPYTKKTLPGVPKSGSTACLSNCLCFLEYFLGPNKTTSEYENFIISKSIGPRVPTEAEYANLMSIRDDYYYNTLMFERTGDVKFKETADAAFSQYNSYQKKNGILINDSLPVSQMLTDFRNMNQNQHFEFIDPKSMKSIDSNSFVGIFTGDHFQYGHVKDVVNNHLKIRVFGGEEVLLEIGRSIAFKEKS